MAFLLLGDGLHSIGGLLFQVFSRLITICHLELLMN